MCFVSKVIDGLLSHTHTHNISKRKRRLVRLCVRALCNDSTPGVDDEGVTPTVPVGVWMLTHLRRSDDPRLRLDGSRLQQDRPVGCSCTDRESGWVRQDVGTLPTHAKRWLCEAHVVADEGAYFAQWRLDGWLQRQTGDRRVALLGFEVASVDIEEVRLAVPLLDQASIVDDQLGVPTPLGVTTSLSVFVLLGLICWLMNTHRHPDLGFTRCLCHGINEIFVLLRVGQRGHSVRGRDEVSGLGQEDCLRACFGCPLDEADCHFCILRDGRRRSHLSDGCEHHLGRASRCLLQESVDSLNAARVLG